MSAEKRQGSLYSHPIGWSLCYHAESRGQIDQENYWHDLTEHLRQHEFVSSRSVEQYVSGLKEVYAALFYLMKFGGVFAATGETIRYFTDGEEHPLKQAFPYRIRTKKLEEVLPQHLPEKTALNRVFWVIPPGTINLLITRVPHKSSVFVELEKPREYEEIDDQDDFELLYEGIYGPILRSPEQTKESEVETMPWHNDFRRFHDALSKHALFLYEQSGLENAYSPNSLTHQALIHMAHIFNPENQQT